MGIVVGAAVIVGATRASRRTKNTVGEGNGAVETALRGDGHMPRAREAADTDRYTYNRYLVGGYGTSVRRRDRGPAVRARGDHRRSALALLHDDRRRRGGRDGHTAKGWDEELIRNRRTKGGDGSGGYGSSWGVQSRFWISVGPAEGGESRERSPACCPQATRSLGMLPVGSTPARHLYFLGMMTTIGAHEKEPREGLVNAFNDKT